MIERTGLLMLFLFVFCISGYGQIYNKKIVYEYEYQIERNNTKHKSLIYLGCLGKAEPTMTEQMAVVWTKSTKQLSYFLPNTGIIESEERVWLHPPRHDEFLFLEYSPFPEIRFPLEVGNKWKWQLCTGSNWCNEEYGINTSTILRYNYEITDSELKKVIAHNKVVECFIVKATATDDIAYRSFVGFFNQFYGFISMEFHNINSEKITFNLTRILPWDSYLQQKLINSNWAN